MRRCVIVVLLIRRSHALGQTRAHAPNTRPTRASPQVMSQGGSYSPAESKISLLSLAVTDWLADDNKTFTFTTRRPAWVGTPTRWLAEICNQAFITAEKALFIF